MHTLAAAFLVTFAALFPIVNPLEGAPLFYVLTRELPQERQHVLARQVAFNGLALLLGSMVLGPWLLVFFGIELPVVRIAGGLVVTSLGWKLLSQEQWSDHPSHQVPQDAMARAGAFYPLTMPLTVGPGSMSVAVSIGSRKPVSGFSLTDFALYGVGAACGLVAVAISIYVAYRFAGNLSRFLGASGIEVLVRLSAFILMCIGIEFLWSGYLALKAAHEIN
ncbi:MAG: NAAT family transporter [Betaproteobacteria bacterium]|jgi:multiple antibiotic resistance protein|nr:MAG: NAAT family transporter [Betaproteobacteria bacterium]